MADFCVTPSTPNENDASPSNAPAPMKRRAIETTPTDCGISAPAAATPRDAAVSAALRAETSAPETAKAVAEPAVPAETDEERLRREMEESEALARQFMAEEVRVVPEESNAPLPRFLPTQPLSAPSPRSFLLARAPQAEASFALQYQLIQSASADMDQVDLVAVQQLLRADEQAQEAIHGGGEEEDEERDEESEEGEPTATPTYEDLIELGRHIGDVKAERWAFRCEP